MALIKKERVFDHDLGVFINGKFDEFPFVFNFYGGDFGVKVPGGLCLCPPLLSLNRVGVALFHSESVFLGQVFRRDSHGQFDVEVG